MASSNCGLFEIFLILGTKLVFYRDSSFCCGDVMRLARLHNEPLVCRRREPGPSTCVFCKVPTLIGLWFLVPLVEPPSARWLPDWKLLALIHLGRCWCLLTGISFMLCPLNRAGDRAKSKWCSPGRPGSITLCKFSIQQSAMLQVRSLEELSSIQANW